VGVPGVRSTPSFSRQRDTDADGYSDFYEEFSDFDKHDAAKPGD
jgi:hypothetical protein